MVRVPHASRRLWWLLLAFEATQYACSTSTGLGSSLGDWLGVLVPLRINPALVVLLVIPTSFLAPLVVSASVLDVQLLV